MNIVAIDTETTLLPPVGKMRFEHHVPDLVVISACDSQRSQLLMPDARKTQTIIRQWFEDPTTILVFHNAAFDLAVLNKAFAGLYGLIRLALKEGRIRDTRVMYCLRNPDSNLKRSLAAACEAVLGVTLEKGDVRTSFRPGVALTDQQKAYALQDAEATFALYKRLVDIPMGGLAPRQPHLRQHEIRAARNPQAPNPDELYSTAAAWMALELEPRGLAVHVPTLRRYAAEAQAIVDEKLEVLVEAGLARWVRKPGAPVRPCTVNRNAMDSRWRPTSPSGRMARCRTRRGDRIAAMRRAGVTKKDIRFGHPKDPGPVLEEVEAQISLNTTALRDAYTRAAAYLGLTRQSRKPPYPPLPGEYPITASGELSMEYDFWKQVAGLPASLQTHLQLGKHRKLLSTYFRPILDRASVSGDEPIRVFPSIGVAFAETGRWSCWRPNLQNQPKRIRDMYQAPYPGHILISADYKSLEMYTACEAMHRLGISGPLRQLLDQGGDVHAGTAELSGLTRQEAKMANFGLLGGMGAQTFRKHAAAYGANWSLDYAYEVRERWLNTFWDVEEFLDLFRKNPWDLRPSGWLKQAFLQMHNIEPDNGEYVTRFELGRKLNNGRIYTCELPTGRIIPNRRYTQAANIFFQGLGADVISLAFHKCCVRGLKVCIIVHDSITVTCKDDDQESVGTKLCEAMHKAQAQICSSGVKIPMPEWEGGSTWS